MFESDRVAFFVRPPFTLGIAFIVVPCAGSFNLIICRDGQVDGGAEDDEDERRRVVLGRFTDFVTFADVYTCESLQIWPNLFTVCCVLVI